MAATVGSFNPEMRGRHISQPRLEPSGQPPTPTPTKTASSVRTSSMFCAARLVANALHAAAHSILRPPRHVVAIVPGLSWPMRTNPRAILLCTPQQVPVAVPGRRALRRRPNRLAARLGSNFVPQWPQSHSCTRRSS